MPITDKDLLDKPLFGTLATIGSDGSPQLNVMWFMWDGTHIKFTTNRTTAKFRNISANPSASFAVADPDNPYRYIQVRGTIDVIEPDLDGDFFVELDERYGLGNGRPDDAADRVVLSLLPTNL